jgi:hypothetical protein
MSITFQKRQKEMKRQEKQRAKAERREQKKVARRAAKEAQSVATISESGTELQSPSQDKQRIPPG